MALARRLIFNGFLAGYWFARIWHDGPSIFRFVGLLVAVGLIFAWTLGEKEKIVAWND